ncbi:MAG: diguanylate cyclase [Desulfobacterales bacterium]|nr:diguanylate cyclase [Desulfobacterales bacterium]
MKIAFPTREDKGADSQVYGHFGSAPRFVIIDDNDDSATTVDNTDADHLHGQCQPLKALGGIEVDKVVVGGIGGGALQKLNHAGIRVFRAVEGTVNENLGLVKTDKLPEFTPDHTCAGHDKDGGCAH